MDNRPIGVFDSGVGGLTVVREIIHTLPQEKIIYIGDTARVPWGTRGKKVITKFSLQLTNFLISKKVKYIVVACHTASSVALPFLQRKVPIPILGVIGPGVEEAVGKSKKGFIGILGTPATIRSGSWEKALRKKLSNVEVFSVSCPLFVPIVEEGLFDHQIAKIMAKEYLRGILSSKVDTIILACTHYPLLEKTIKEIAGKVSLINPGKATAKFLKKSLFKKRLNGKTRAPEHELYFTDPSHQAIKIINKFLGESKSVKIKEINL